MFSADQLESLKEGLEKKHVSKRKLYGNSGPELSYIEGWLAIAEANRIFGFDGWDRETFKLACLSERNYTKNGDAMTAVGYMAQVRIRVRAGEDIVTREGVGFGSGSAKNAEEAHESAIKEAETDAMKRAFITFGDPFGLALYDKTQANVINSTENNKGLHGPLSKTELGKRIKAMVGELHECQYQDELDAVEAKYTAEVEQCKRDLPVWYKGKEATDTEEAVEGLSDKIKRLREATPFRGASETQKQFEDQLRSPA